MTKSELIEALSRRNHHLAHRDIEIAVKNVLEIMCRTLSGGERIEIRGFGSFSLRHRLARTGRNPKTGKPVALSAKHVPFFKPGKELRARVDLGPRDKSAPGAAKYGPGPDSSWRDRFAGVNMRG